MKKPCEFDFIAYMSPPPANARGDGNLQGEGNENFQTEEHYRNIVDCGFNGISAIYEYDEEEYQVALELCDKFGLKMLVRDQKGLEPYVVKQLCKEEMDAETWLLKEGDGLKSRLDVYQRHPSFAGILAADEPHSGKFPQLRILQDWFKERFPDKEFEINLLPDYASVEQLTGQAEGKHDYQKHLDDFISVVQPEYLSYDHYALCIDPTTKKPYIRTSYFKNLEMVAKTAKAAKIPFKVFLLTLGHWDFRTVSTYADIAWQIYTSLAYGAAGAQTFTYWTMLGYPPGNEARVTTGVVGVEGELLPAWYAMQEVLHEARVFERNYFAYEWQKCCYFTVAQNNPLFATLDKNSDEFLKDVKVDGDLLVGCFTKANARAYLFSNAIDPIQQQLLTVSVRLEKECALSVWRKGEKQVFPLSQEYHFALRAGEGIFIEIEQR